MGHGTLHGVGEKWDDMEDRHDRDDRSAHGRGIADRAPKTYFSLVAVLLISIAVVAVGQVAANLLMSRRPFGPMP